MWLALMSAAVAGPPFALGEPAPGGDESHHLVQVGDFWLSQRIAVVDGVVDSSLLTAVGAAAAAALTEWYRRERPAVTCPVVPQSNGVAAVGRDSVQSWVTDTSAGWPALRVVELRAPGAVCQGAGTAATLPTVVDLGPVEAGWSARVSVQAADVNPATLGLLRDLAARCLQRHPDVDGTWTRAGFGPAGARAEAADGTSSLFAVCLEGLPPTPGPATFVVAPTRATGSRVTATGDDERTAARVAEAAERCLAHQPSVYGAIDLPVGDPEWADRALVERRAQGSDTAMFLGCLSAEVAMRPLDVPVSLTIAPPAP